MKALHLAYPSVKRPTSPVQCRFTHTVLSGKDVLPRDKTGSRKCVIRASTSSLAHADYVDVITGAQLPSITSVLLVPRRDLAFQFFHPKERVHQYMTCLP